MRRWSVLAALLLVSCLAAATEIQIATWNIRMLTSRSRTDTELEVIARILSRYDLIAVQEARDALVIERLMAMLPGHASVVSVPIGRRVTERYAFVYRESRVELLGSPAILADPDDLFIREPFIASFRAGSFDFTLVTVHVVYGNSIGERRAEVGLLDDVVALVDEANGSEDDVILLGDFNLDADDKAWEMISHTPVVPPTVMTTISDASSYDNIWLDLTRTTEVAPVALVYRFDEFVFANDDSAASLAVSDHRPVSVVARTDGEDDDEGGEFGDGFVDAVHRATQH
jgi:endonuclease/exonuclease/phosphatase family metal-dependent hydrolase